MGTIKYKKGDLISLFDKGEFDCIAHQCNVFLISIDCGGIAQKIFNTYEQTAVANSNAILTYRKNNCSYSLLGKVTGCIDVYNIYSQYKPGSPTHGIDSMECRLYYLKEGLNTIKQHMGANNQTKLGIPLIASGLAKQHNMKAIPDLIYFKKFILPTVKEVFKNSLINVTVVYL